MSMRETFVLALLSIVLFVASATAAERDIQIRSIDLQNAVIELFNFGTTDESLDRWQFCTQDDNQTRVYSSFSGLNGVTIEAGTSFFIHFNNDAPGGPDSRNASQVGRFAGPLDTGPYGMSLYFPPVSFSNGNRIADHLQWSEGGVDNDRADERSDEAQAGGVWTDQSAWIATDADTIRIRLVDESGKALHGPDDYEAIGPPQEGAAFHRGDSDGSGTIDITDGVVTLNILFVGGEDVGCKEAQDFNNDGVINITDGVATFSFLFAGGPPPVAPGPTTQPCGPDPDATGSPQDLGCDSYGGC